jgi:phosphoserine phosphatase RsbU/P
MTETDSSTTPVLEEEAPTPSSARKPSRISPERHRILVADDDGMNRDIMSERLQFEGYQVETVCDGREALTRLREEKFDLVLLDLVMPEIEGDEVLKTMKADPELREIPVIMISGLDELDTVARCIELGADDYLPKPYKPVLLRARINACLERKQLHEQEQATYQALKESQKHLAGELSEAADYVTSLLPPPLTGEVTSEWKFIPSTQLGGDSFGYHWLDDNHLAMYLLDVCGHGVGAALLSISAMNVMRSHSLTDTDFRDPGNVLMALNEMFQMERHNNMYFTIWYGVYNKAENTIVHSCGGHPPAILLTGEDRASAEAVMLKVPGLVIGTLPDMHYGNQTQQLGKYNELFVFSDGVYEVDLPDGGMWEFEDFVKLVTQPPPEGKSEIDVVADQAREYQGNDNFEDDFSMVKFVFPTRP